MTTDPTTTNIPAWARARLDALTDAQDRAELADAARAARALLRQAALFGLEHGPAVARIRDWSGELAPDGFDEFGQWFDFVEAELADYRAVRAVCALVSDIAQVTLGERPYVDVHELAFAAGIDGAGVESIAQAIKTVRYSSPVVVLFADHVGVDGERGYLEGRLIADGRRGRAWFDAGQVDEVRETIAELGEARVRVNRSQLAETEADR